jgi:hypothetical protein
MKLEESDILALWKRFDANRDGVFARVEFVKFVSVSFKKHFNVELPLPTALVDEGFKMFDLNNSGSIVYHEFKASINNYWSNRESIVNRYYVHSADGRMVRKPAGFGPKLIQPVLPPPQSHPNTEPILPTNPILKSVRPIQASPVTAPTPAKETIRSPEELVPTLFPACDPNTPEDASTCPSNFVHRWIRADSASLLEIILPDGSLTGVFRNTGTRTLVVEGRMNRIEWLLSETSQPSAQVIKLIIPESYNFQIIGMSVQPELGRIILQLPHVS